MTFLDRLPTEIELQIFAYVPFVDVLHLMCTNKTFNIHLRSWDFWRWKAELDLNITKEVFECHGVPLNPIKRFFQFYAYHNAELHGSERYVSSLLCYAKTRDEYFLPLLPSPTDKDFVDHIDAIGLTRNLNLICAIPDLTPGILSNLCDTVPPQILTELIIKRSSSGNNWTNARDINNYYIAMHPSEDRISTRDEVQDGNFDWIAVSRPPFMVGATCLHPPRMIGHIFLSSIVKLDTNAIDLLLREADYKRYIDHIRFIFAMLAYHDLEIYINRLLVIVPITTAVKEGLSLGYAWKGNRNMLLKLVRRRLFSPRALYPLIVNKSVSLFAEMWGVTSRILNSRLRSIRNRIIELVILTRNHKLLSDISQIVPLVDGVGEGLISKAIEWELLGIIDVFISNGFDATRAVAISIIRKKSDLAIRLLERINVNKGNLWNLAIDSGDMNLINHLLPFRRGTGIKSIAKGRPEIGTFMIRHGIIKYDNLLYNAALSDNIGLIKCLLDIQPDKRSDNAKVVDKLRHRIRKLKVNSNMSLDRLTRLKAMKKIIKHH